VWKRLWEKVDFIGFVVSLAVEEHYPSKANYEKMSLYGLIAFSVMANRRFGECIRGRVGSLGSQALPKGRVQ